MSFVSWNEGLSSGGVRSLMIDDDDVMDMKKIL